MAVNIVAVFVCDSIYSGGIRLLQYISKVSDQNGTSLLYIMLEIHQSGREP